MELTNFEEAVVRHIMSLSGTSLHACRSALRHLERSWTLSADYPEVAAFCAITAEEESATAVFNCLKQLRYPGAEELKLRDHVHKTALHPFLLAIGRAVDGWLSRYKPALEFNADLSHDAVERLRIRLSVGVSGKGEQWAYPLPPLNFRLSLNNVPHDFSAELRGIATEKESRSAYEYVRGLANRRNQMLYASSTGMPHWVGTPERFIRYRQSVVFSNFMAILLIHPYAEHQLFVRQAILAFLKLLRRFPQENDDT